MSAMSDRAPRVAADGVDAAGCERLGALAGRDGFALVGSSRPGEKAPAAEVLVMSAMGNERLGAMLMAPYRGYVEYRDDDALGRRIAAGLDADGLYVALTTPTAFHGVDTARLFCDALVARGALPLHLRANVEMALHETVANAVLHGNLRTNIALMDDADYYTAFCDHLKQLVANPEAYRRWIEITAIWAPGGLTLDVDDEGEGFEAPSGPLDAETAGAHGRGLAIIQTLASSVEFSRGGRRTTLRFAHER